MVEIWYFRGICRIKHLSYYLKWEIIRNFRRKFDRSKKCKFGTIDKKRKKENKEKKKQGKENTQYVYNYRLAVLIYINVTFLYLTAECKYIVNWRVIETTTYFSGEKVICALLFSMISSKIKNFANKKIWPRKSRLGSILCGTFLTNAHRSGGVHSRYGSFSTYSFSVP